MKEISINIIGMGYVGGSISYLCEKNNIEFNVCDIQEKKGDFNYFNNIKELVNFSENNSDINFYIICVPTPSDSEGNCDTSIVNDVLMKLEMNTTKETKESYVIIKSTLVPGTLKQFNEEYSELNIVFCPEFLTEKNHLNDIYNAKFILLGTPENFDMIKYQKISKVMRLLYRHNSEIDILKKSYEECELFKYTVNNFLAVKVWYFNKIYDISESLCIDYQNFKQLFELEPRISGYGTRCPGDNGTRGFGGNCLVKDQNGMIKLLEKLEIDNTVLKYMAVENEEMRKKIN